MLISQKSNSHFQFIVLLWLQQSRDCFCWCIHLEANVHPSICYTCFLLHSGSRGFAGAYPSCNRAVVGYTLDKTAVHHRALKQTQMKENCVDFLLWTSLPFYGLKSQKGLSLISALTSNPCLGLSWCGPDYNAAQNNGTWLSFLLLVDCLFSCILWLNDQLSSLWGLRLGSTGISMPVGLITKFQLPAFRSLVCANRKLPFRNLKSVTFDSKPSF